MGPRDAQPSSPAAGVCRGLVRIRQQTQLSTSRRGGGAILLDARMGDASRLNEDEWYFCVLRKAGAGASIQWFSIRGEGDASDDDDASQEHGDEASCTRSDSVLVTATVISHFEVVDDSSASEKAHDHEDAQEDGNARASIAEFNGLKLDAEECTFYMEDHVQGVSGRPHYDIDLV